jgi:hypothetical protein
MAIVKYEFTAGTGDIAAEFRSITERAKASRLTPTRRAWRWCMDRPWLMFAVGLAIGQSFVAVTRLL